MKKYILLILVTIAPTFLTVFAQTKSSNAKIEIKDAWIRPAPKGENSALYFAADNPGKNSDFLIGVKTKLANMVEIHETYKKDNDKMGMRPVKQVEIPTNSKVEFKPRGMHVMLLDLTKDLNTGSTYEITFRFKNAGTIKVKAVVKDM